MGERGALDSDDDFDNDTKRKDDNDDAEAEAALQKLLGFFGRLDRAAAAAAAAAAEEGEEANSDLVTGASNESIIAPAQADFSIASVATQEADDAPEVDVPEGSKDHLNLAPSSAEIPKDRPKQVENVGESAKEEEHKDFDQAIDKSSSIDTHKQRRTEEPKQVTSESPRPESDKHINQETAESPTSQTLANVLHDKGGSPKPKILETSHRGERAENQTQKSNEERSSASESFKHEEVLETKHGPHDNAVKESSKKGAPLSPNVQKTSAAAPKFKPTMLVETLDESDLEDGHNSDDEDNLEDDNDNVLSDGEHQAKAVSAVVSPVVSGTTINPLYSNREANVSSNKLAAGLVPVDTPHSKQKPPSLLSQRSLSSNMSSSSAQSGSQGSLFKQELEKANCATTQNSMQSNPFPQTPPLIQADAPVAKQEPMTPQASNIRGPNEVSTSSAQAQGFATPTSKLHMSTKSSEPESPLLSVSQRTYRSAGENLWENVDHDDRISTFSFRHVVAARKPAKRDETPYPEWLETVELLAHKLPNKGPLRRTALTISAVTYASLSTSTLASFANAPKDIISAKAPVGVMPAVHRELTRFFLNFTSEERHRVRELCLVPGMTFAVARALVKTYGVEVMNSTETPASLSAMLEISSLQRMGMLAALMDGRLCRRSQHQQHQQRQQVKEEKEDSTQQLKVSKMSPSQPADCPRQPEERDDHPKAFPMPTSQREGASSHLSHPESKKFDVLHVEVPEIWQGMYERVLVTVGNNLVSLTEVLSQVPEFFALETSGPLRVQRKVGVIEERNVSGQTVEMRRMIGIRKSAQPQQHIVVDILVVHERLAVKDAVGDQAVQSQGQPTNGLLTDLMKLYFRSHAKQASADSRSAAAQALRALQDQLQVRFPDALGTLRQFLALEGQAESTSSASSPLGKSVLGKRQRLL